MNWPIGAKVACHGLNWGECRVALHNGDLIMIHCAAHDLVVCGEPRQLQAAGWRLIPQNNIVRLDHWRRDRTSDSARSRLDPFGS
jgi:hypothetical protein